MLSLKSKCTARYFHFCKLTWVTNIFNSNHNIRAVNFPGNVITGNLTSNTASVVGNVDSGNVNTGGQVSATGNGTFGNLSATLGAGASAQVMPDTGFPAVKFTAAFNV